MHGTFKIRSVKLDVSQLMGDGKALPIRRMKRIDADNGHTVSDVGEPREFAIERRILNARSKRLSNPLNWNWGRPDPVLVK
jgi:hypothetical protein